MLLRRSRAPRYSNVCALALVDRQSATQEHPPDHSGQSSNADQHRPGLHQHRAESQKAAITEHLRCTRQRLCREDAESDERASGSRGATDRRVNRGAVPLATPLPRTSDTREGGRRWTASAIGGAIHRPRSGRRRGGSGSSPERCYAQWASRHECWQVRRHPRLERPT